MRLWLVLVLLALVASGCVTKQYGIPSTSPPATSATPAKTYADFYGNWSTANGTFQLYATRTVVERWNETRQVWEPLTTQRVPRQPLPFKWENGTLWLGREAAIHPYDPGPLTAVWIQEQVFGPEFNIGGFFGVNEKPMNRSLPLLPNPYTYRDTFLFLNVTFDRTSESPPRHEVTVQGHAFADATSGNVTTEARDPHTGLLYRAVVRLDYVGTFPYGTIRRF